ncbi:MAG: hypothetical protein FD153_1901 [Rhodospirillaceae bacterium]|nr:MAG: hypothetical protein FD153_1901 [Rhodospirillaceae bacterium]
MRSTDLNLPLRGLLLLITLAAVGWLVKVTGFDQVLDTVWIDTRIKGNGLAGEALFVAAGALFTALGLPRQVICFLGGYAFGFLEGGWLAMLASVGGCLGSFGYARLLGRSVVLARFPDRIRRLDAFLRGNPFIMTLLIRLLPVGSNLLTNLAGGVSGIQASAFIAGSALGYVPQTVIFAFLGSGIQVDPIFRIGLSIVLFGLSAALGVWILRRQGVLVVSGPSPES